MMATKGHLVLLCMMLLHQQIFVLGIPLKERGRPDPNSDSDLDLATRTKRASSSSSSSSSFTSSRSFTSSCLCPSHQLDSICPYQGFFSHHEGDCDKFLLCAPGPNNGYTAFVASCPEGKEFSPTMRTCVESQFSGCGHRFDESDVEEFFSHGLHSKDKQEQLEFYLKEYKKLLRTLEKIKELSIQEVGAGTIEEFEFASSSTPVKTSFTFEEIFGDTTSSTTFGGGASTLKEFEVEMSKVIAEKIRESVAKAFPAGAGGTSQVTEFTVTVEEQPVEITEFEVVGGEDAYEVGGISQGTETATEFVDEVLQVIKVVEVETEVAEFTEEGVTESEYETEYEGEGGYAAPVDETIDEELPGRVVHLSIISPVDEAEIIHFESEVASSSSASSTVSESESESEVLEVFEVVESETGILPVTDIVNADLAPLVETIGGVVTEVTGGSITGTVTEIVQEVVTGQQVTELLASAGLGDLIGEVTQGELTAVDLGEVTTLIEQLQEGELPLLLERDVIEGLVPVPIQGGSINVEEVLEILKANGVTDGHVLEIVNGAPLDAGLTVAELVQGGGVTYLVPGGATSLTETVTGLVSEGGATEVTSVVTGILEDGTVTGLLDEAGASSIVSGLLEGEDGGQIASVLSVGEFLTNGGVGSITEQGVLTEVLDLESTTGTLTETVAEVLGGGGVLGSTSTTETLTVLDDLPLGGSVLGEEGILASEGLVNGQLVKDLLGGSGGAYSESGASEIEVEALREVKAVNIESLLRDDTGSSVIAAKIFELQHPELVLASPDSQSPIYTDADGQLALAQDLLAQLQAQGFNTFDGVGALGGAAHALEILNIDSLLGTTGGLKEILGGGSEGELVTVTTVADTVSGVLTNGEVLTTVTKLVGEGNVGPLESVTSILDLESSPVGAGALTELVEGSQLTNLETVTGLLDVEGLTSGTDLGDLGGLADGTVLTETVTSVTETLTGGDILSTSTGTLTKLAGGQILSNGAVGDILEGGLLSDGGGLTEIVSEDILSSSTGTLTDLADGQILSDGALAEILEGGLLSDGGLTEIVGGDKVTEILTVGEGSDTVLAPVVEVVEDVLGGGDGVDEILNFETVTDIVGGDGGVAPVTGVVSGILEGEGGVDELVKLDTVTGIVNNGEILPLGDVTDVGQVTEIVTGVLGDSDYGAGGVADVVGILERDEITEILPVDIVDVLDTDTLTDVVDLGEVTTLLDNGGQLATMTDILDGDVLSADGVTSVLTSGGLTEVLNGDDLLPVDGVTGLADEVLSGGILDTTGGLTTILDGGAEDGGLLDTAGGVTGILEDGSILDTTGGLTGILEDGSILDTTGGLTGILEDGSILDATGGVTGILEDGSILDTTGGLPGILEDGSILDATGGVTGILEDGSILDTAGGVTGILEDGSILDTAGGVTGILEDDGILGTAGGVTGILEDGGILGTAGGVTGILEDDGILGSAGGVTGILEDGSILDTTGGVTGILEDDGILGTAGGVTGILEDGGILGTAGGVTGILEDDGILGSAGGVTGILEDGSILDTTGGVTGILEDDGILGSAGGVTGILEDDGILGSAGGVTGILEDGSILDATGGLTGILEDGSILDTTAGVTGILEDDGILGTAGGVTGILEDDGILGSAGGVTGILDGGAEDGGLLDAAGGVTGILDGGTDDGGLLASTGGVTSVVSDVPLAGGILSSGGSNKGLAGGLLSHKKNTGVVELETEAAEDYVDGGVLATSQVSTSTSSGSHRKGAAKGHSQTHGHGQGLLNHKLLG